MTLPAALPGFFPGVRLAAANAFTALVSPPRSSAVRKGWGSTSTTRELPVPDPADLRGILTLGLLGITINLALSGVERRLTRWQKGLTNR